MQSKSSKDLVGVERILRVNGYKTLLGKKSGKYELIRQTRRLPVGMDDRALFGRGTEARVGVRGRGPCRVVQAPRVAHPVDDLIGRGDPPISDRTLISNTLMSSRPWTSSSSPSQYTLPSDVSATLVKMEFFW